MGTSQDAVQEIQEALDKGDEHQVEITYYRKDGKCTIIIEKFVKMARNTVRGAIPSKTLDTIGNCQRPITWCISTYMCRHICITNL